MRSGAALLEALVTAICGALLLSSAAGVLSTYQRLSRTDAEIVDREHALHIAGTLLRSELRYAVMDEDIRAIASDSIALRVFRGRLRVCEDGRATVVSGLRDRWPAAVRARTSRAPAPPRHCCHTARL